MSCFRGISFLSKCEILMLTDAISVALSDGLDSDDINTLGNLLMTIGSVMTTFVSLSKKQESKNAADSEINLEPTTDLNSKSTIK